MTLRVSKHCNNAPSYRAVIGLPLTQGVSKHCINAPGYQAAIGLPSATRLDSKFPRLGAALLPSGHRFTVRDPSGLEVSPARCRLGICVPTDKYVPVLSQHLVLKSVIAIGVPLVHLPASTHHVLPEASPSTTLIAALPVPLPERLVVTAMLTGAAIVATVPASEVSSLRLKPMPTPEPYEESAFTIPVVQSAEAPNEGEQPLLTHVGLMQVVVETEPEYTNVKALPFSVPVVT